MQIHGQPLSLSEEEKEDKSEDEAQNLLRDYIDDLNEPVIDPAPESNTTSASTSSSRSNSELASPQSTTSSSSSTASASSNVDWSDYVSRYRDISTFYDDLDESGLYSGGEQGNYYGQTGRAMGDKWEKDWVKKLNTKYGTNHDDVGDFTAEQFGQAHYEHYGAKEGRELSYNGTNPGGGDTGVIDSYVGPGAVVNVGDGNAGVGGNNTIENNFNTDKEFKVKTKGGSIYNYGNLGSDLSTNVNNINMFNANANGGGNTSTTASSNFLSGPLQAALDFNAAGQAGYIGAGTPGISTTLGDFSRFDALSPRPTNVLRSTDALISRNIDETRALGDLRMKNLFGDMWKLYGYNIEDENN